MKIELSFDLISLKYFIRRILVFLFSILLVVPLLSLLVGVIGGILYLLIFELFFSSIIMGNPLISDAASDAIIVNSIRFIFFPLEFIVGSLSIYYWVKQNWFYHDAERKEREKLLKKTVKALEKGLNS